MSIFGRNRTEKELALLWCLERENAGMYGSQLAAITGIGRASVYIHLARLEDRGLVLRRVEEPSSAAYPGRHRYYRTAK